MIICIYLREPQEKAALGCHVPSPALPAQHSACTQQAPNIYTPKVHKAVGGGGRRLLGSSHSDSNSEGRNLCF